MYGVVMYFALGATWVGLGVITGYFKVRVYDRRDTFMALAILTVFWPYLLFRILRNISEGNPNGSVWP